MWLAKIIFQFIAENNSEQQLQTLVVKKLTVLFMCVVFFFLGGVANLCTCCYLFYLPFSFKIPALKSNNIQLPNQRC